MEVTTIVTREEVLERGREARAYFRKPLMELYPSGMPSLCSSGTSSLAIHSAPANRVCCGHLQKEVTVPFARSPVPSYGLAHCLVWHVVLPVIPALRRLRQGAYKFEYRPHSKF